MRILIVSQYFYPESFIINDLVKSLVLQGHVIDVLTGKPNYPDGDIFPGYKARGCLNEYLDGEIVVHRVPIFPRGKGGAKRLLLNYTSFVLSGLLYFYRAIKGNKFDVIFVFANSPITAVIPAMYLKMRLKTHLAVWVQDLWPEALSAMGFIKNRYLLGLAGWMVRWIYACSDTLLIQSKAFHKPMLKYAAEKKIIYYPNSCLDVPFNLTQKNEIPTHLLFELEHNFCIVFAGNLGTAQSVETLIKTAEKLNHLTDFKLVLVGSGSMSDWIKQRLIDKKLNNVVVAGRFPSAMMPSIFSLAKGLLVTLKQDEIFTYTIPSKIQTYLAAGRPLIASIDGEGARVIQEAGAGFVSSAEDAVGLANNIETFYWMTLSQREELGQAGRAYFIQHFEMGAQARRLTEILEERINKRSCLK